MPDQSESKGQFGDVSFGDVRGGQFVFGNQNTATQNVGLSAEEAAELVRGFEQLRKAAASIDLPPAQRSEAVAKTEELEREIRAEQPDPGRVRRVLRWFGENTPALAGTIAHFIGGPLVGKLVEGAG